MKIFGKKSGFSLMEIVIAVLIVAILALVVSPIVGRQMQKSKEYSYYLAYRTLEKMAGQVIMLGDPEASTTSYNYVKPSFMDSLIAKVNYYSKPLKHFANKMEIKWAYTEGKLFSRFFSKTHASQRVRKLVHFKSDDFDNLVLCQKLCVNGDKVPQGLRFDSTGDWWENPEKAKIYYKKDEVCSCDVFASTVDDSIAFKDLLFNDDIMDSSVYANIFDKFKIEAGKKLSFTGRYMPEYAPISAQEFCNYFIQNIKLNSEYSSKYTLLINSPSGYDPDLNDDDKPITSAGPSCDDASMSTKPTQDEFEYCYWVTNQSQTPGECSLYVTYEAADNHGTYTLENNFNKPIYSGDWCTEHGYKNFTNVANPDAIDCQPISGYAVTENNEKAAYPKCEDGYKLYEQCNSAGVCDGICLNVDFNEVTQQPCGSHSRYSGGLTCECISGWTRGDDGECSKKTLCPAGTTELGSGENRICVANPPVIKAQSLCRLIKENWNVRKDAVGSDSCSLFTPKSAEKGVPNVYTQLYDVIIGNDNKYLSLNSKEGAFSTLPPNIVMGNGLKIWILGDKAASIPGLSFYTNNAGTGTEKYQNMCILLKDKTKDDCKKSVSDQYHFCKSDNNCFDLDSSSRKGTTAADRQNYLYDARGCCTTQDFSDLRKIITNDNELFKYYQEPTVYAVPGFTVFVDIDGDKGSGTLWDDVFPFYIATDGRVYPGYPLDGDKTSTTEKKSLYWGGNSEQMLPTDVYYYENSSTGKQLARKTAFANVSFARAVCSARIVSWHTPYCLNLGGRFKAKGTDGNDLDNDYLQKDKKEESKNPCDHHKCYVSVRNKLRFF